MTKAELLELYISLKKDDKVRFLALLSFEVTIWMREDYDDSVDCNRRVKRLMGANELQHHISSELRHHLDQDAERYPDDVLINILLEKSSHYDISEKLQSALIRTAKRFRA